jgi:hypothetical protein
MLQEGDQRSRHGHNLGRRDVHVLDAVRRGQGEFVTAAAGHQVAGETALGVQLRVRLGDHVLAFLDSRQVFDLVGDLVVHHLAVGGLDEAVLVGAGVQGQGVDQADVRTFRRFDRADPAVMGGVHVAHFEAGALPGQTAGAQGGDTPLVGDLGQGVGLVHELGQLG